MKSAKVCKVSLDTGMNVLFLIPALKHSVVIQAVLSKVDSPESSQKVAAFCKPTRPSHLQRVLRLLLPGQGGHESKTWHAIQKPGAVWKQGGAPPSALL